MRLDPWLWAVSRSDRPILIGPWRSEVGFEVLYWLPYLDALRRRIVLQQTARVLRWRRWRLQTLTAADLQAIERPIEMALRERLVVVTRGGAGAWYDVGQSVELYDHAPPESLRVEALADQQRTGSIKQGCATPFDRAVLRVVQERCGYRRCHVLFPSAMYRDLAPWWEDRATLPWLLRRVAFRTRLPLPPKPVGLALPERFIAVRFYARATWPLSEEAREWTEALVAGIAARMPVVVLSSGPTHYDDHLDLSLAGANITTATAPDDHHNLGWLSAVLGRASGFIGTYGGMQQLALRCGVPSVGVYAQFGGTAYAHKVLGEWLGVQQGTSYLVGRPEDVGAVCQLAGQPLAFPPPARRGSSGGQP